MSELSANGAMTISTASQRVLAAVYTRRKPLPFTNADGSVPLVVALPRDYLSATLDRVRDAGGSANVAVADTKGYKVVVLEIDEVADEDEGGDEYPDDMSMGMFMIRLGSRRGESTFRLSGVRAGLSSASGLLAYA